MRFDLPAPDLESMPFWDAAKDGRLLIKHCNACNENHYYPRPFCPECRSPNHEWTRMSGRGTVYTYTIVARPLTRWFKDKVPVAVAVVELDEGVRMMSNVIDIDPEQVQIGMPVEVTWEDVTDEITLPKFRPAGTQ